MGAKTLPRPRVMSGRLPQPANPKTVRLVVDDAELRRAEFAATQCRLSVASFARALFVAACDNPEWFEEVKKAAAKIGEEPPPGRAKPGRPQKGRKP